MKYVHCFALLAMSTVPVLVASNRFVAAQEAATQRPDVRREAVTKVLPALVNRVSKCVTVRFGDVVDSRNLALVEARLEVHETIGSCGCTSALLSYRVTGNVAGSSREFSTGAINTLSRVGRDEEMYLVLSTDREMLASAPKLVVTLGCSAPH